MGFWKELGVASIEKGKSFFRSGKQSLEAAKGAESLVKGAKVTKVAAEKGNAVEVGVKVAQASKPVTGRPTNYLAWENTLPKPNFTPSFNGRWDRFKYAVKDSWSSFWKNSPKTPKPEVVKNASAPSLFDRMKNWFGRSSQSSKGKDVASEMATPAKSASSPSLFGRMKSWFSKGTHSKETTTASVETIASAKPARKTIFKDSGYLAWEKSLPEASFKPKFNAVAKPTETAKATKEAAKVEKTASKAEKAGAQGTENRAKAASQSTKEAKEAQKAVSETAEAATKETAATSQEAVKQESTLKKAARFYAKNPKIMGWHALMGIGTYGVLSGEGVLKPMLYFVGGKNAAENGLGGMVGQAVAGDKAPEIYDKVTNAAGAVVDEGVNLYQTGKNAIGGVAGEGVDLYNMGKNYVGNGMVSNGNGGYYDPSTPAYPNPYTASDPNMNPQEGMLGGMMNGMNEAVNQVSGGNVSKMNILTLALSAYMMFGRFGWLGKAASLLLGGMTLKNINHRQINPSQGQMQQQVPQQQQGQTQIPAVKSQPPMYKELENETSSEDDIVYRSRGMRM